MEYRSPIESIKNSSLLDATKKDIPIALEAYQHYGFWNSKGTIDGQIGDKDIWYYVRKGFVGDNTISLESSIKKGYFWRVSDSDLILDKYELCDKFFQDATFIPCQGIEDYLLLSLRPYSKPKSYVRHFLGKINIWGHIIFDDYDRDRTWRVIYQKNQD